MSDEVNEAGDRGGYEDRDGLSEPGWYTYYGGIRFHDGEDWIGDPHPPVTTISYWTIAAAVTFGVAAGVVIAWFLVWIGAQISPDHIYWPVKFVVKEVSELQTIR